MSEWQRAATLNERIAQLARTVRNVFNWRLIRSLGQLQILTRASYVMLIVVPVLAATWPGVRLVVNQHNRAVREAAELLRSSRIDFERAVDAIDSRVTDAVPVAQVNLPSKVQDVAAGARASAERIAAAAERYTSDYAEHTIGAPRLPWTLAATFFGALFVVFGHLVYQMSAPEAVRQETWDDFVRKRKEDYAKYQSEAALDRAQEFLGTREGDRVAASETFEDERVLERLFSLNSEDRAREVKALSLPRLRSLIAWIDSGKSPAPIDYLNGIRALAAERLPATAGASHTSMALIERGARAEYLYAATQRPLAVLLTGILYAMALWIVLLVVKVQATAVITAAEWSSVGDLFVH